MLPKLRGRLLECVDSDLKGRVFYVEDGDRHWVPTPQHFEFYGFRWQDVTQVKSEIIRAYRHSGQLPMVWSDEAWRKPPGDNPHVLREVATSKLRGSGIEFGAGSGPLAVPIQCKVRYADFLPEHELRKRAYLTQGTDFVRIDYVTRLETLEGLEDGSLDFVIACHVIEHLRNPLQALERVHRKLKPGGQFVLVVPDKRLTFDKDRDLTSIEHLVLDYERALPERDILHYVEFFTRAFVTPVEKLYQRIVQAIADNYDIHFHVWTYDSFHSVVDYCQMKLCRWSSVWSHPPADHSDANEFYFVLTK